MKHLKFKSINIEGFSSFVRKQTFLLDRGGINLIFGDNGNGKTTMFSALMWVLFKINLKGVSNVASWEHLRGEEWAGTRVVITLNTDEVDYMIVRHVKFTGTTKGIKGGDKLMIFVNGELLGDEQHKGDQEDYIERVILGINSTIFTNSLLFGQRMKRLVEASNEEKRELLEATFETLWINAAKEKASRESAMVTTELNTIDKELAVLESSKVTYDDQIFKAENVVAEFEKQRYADILVKKENLTKKKKELEELKKEITSNETLMLAESSDTTALEEEIETLKKDKKGFEAKQEEGINLEVGLRTEIEYSIRLIKKFQEEKEHTTDTCLTCKQKLKDIKIETVLATLDSNIKKEQDVIAVLEQQLEDKLKPYFVLIEKIELATTNIKAKELELKDLKTNNQTLKDLETKLIQQRTSVGFIEETILTLNTDIKNIKSKKAPELDITHLKTSLGGITSNLEVINKIKQEKSEYYKQLTFWVDKGFGANGLKAYIFKAMLENLNVATQQYASRLGAYVRFSIDTTKSRNNFVTTCIKKEIFIDASGKESIIEVEADYKELSGGERQRVDICLAFGFHDMVKFKVDANILIMDEIFENLDAKGVEIVFDLIRLKTTDAKSIYAITHLSQLDTLNAKSITIGKEDNSSVVIDG